MSDLSEEWLKKIRTLANGATDGPWDYEETPYRAKHADGGGRLTVVFRRDGTYGGAVARGRALTETGAVALAGMTADATTAVAPVTQTKLHDPPEVYGNCVAASIASVFEVAIDDVPPFEKLMRPDADAEWPDDWYGALSDWAYREHGVVVCAVVWSLGALAWDPYPGGEGLEEKPCEFIWFAHAHHLSAIAGPEDR